MAKKLQHWEICEAPMCAGGPNLEEATWLANEPYCRMRPYKKWQKKQAKMSRHYDQGVFEHPDRYWTVDMLNKRFAITKQMKGVDSDART